MQHLDRDARQAVLATLRCATAIDSGPTSEQAALLDLVGTHLLGLEGADVGGLEPHDAATAITDPDLRRLVGEGLVTLEMMRHPPSAALVDRVDGYLDALGFAGPEQLLVRDAVAGERDRVVADWARTRTVPVAPARIADDGAAVIGQLAELGECAPGSLGRAFHDFTYRHGFTYEADHLSLVSHDFAHVIAGYEAVPEGELALQAFLVSATGGGAHASGLLASLLLDEVGLLPFPDIEPKVAVLDRPGAAALFADAVLRGSRTGQDIQELDHVGLADRDLAALRAELGISVPETGPFTLP